VFLQVLNIWVELTKVRLAGFIVFLHAFIPFGFEKALVFAYSCSGFTVFLDFVHRLRALFQKRQFCLRKSKVFRVRFQGLCSQNSVFLQVS
jgi:hypothetical protein